jgi:hypothetical protein
MKKGLWMTLIVVFSILFAFSASQAEPFKIAAIFQTAIFSDGHRGALGWGDPSSLSASQKRNGQHRI